MSLKLAFLLI
jgi:hypothetical protein